MNKTVYIVRFYFLALLFLSAFQWTFAQNNFPTEFPDRIILNATPDPATSIAITWRTNTYINEGFCEIQPVTNTRIVPEKSISLKAFTRTAGFGNQNETIIPANSHSLIVSGLIPGNKYIYRVGTGQYWSEWFEFITPSADTKHDLSFVYFGDPQVNIRSEWSRVVRKAYQLVPDCQFMLYAGDIINRSGSDMEWNDWFSAGSYLFSSVPQILTPGNHDYRDGKLDIHWGLQFAQPKNGPNGLKGTCFFVDYPNLRLISIDSASGSELKDENGYEMTIQKNWLDSVLRTNTKKWVILTTHLPFYSTKDTRDNPQLRKHFQPIIEKYKVDLVLTGHDHSYGRGSASDTPGLKPSVVYVVSVSGPKLYPEGTKKWMERKGGNVQLLQKIVINERSLVYKSYTCDGIVFDSFRINQNKKGKKNFKDNKQD